MTAANHPQYVQPYYVKEAPTNGMAVAALVLGILGVFPLALIFGHVAMHSIKTSETPQAGRGMAIAGLVLGYVSLAGWVLLTTVITLAVLSTPAM